MIMNQPSYSKLIKRKEKPGAMKARTCYLLSGKIVCGKCGSTYAGNSYKNRKSKINNVHDICFTEEAIQEVVQKVAVLFQEQQSSSRFEKKAIEKKMQSLENSIDNWIEALGKGIKGLKNKILEAQNRYEALQIELQKIESLKQADNISEELIRNIMTNKKHLLQSADESDRKEVLQEYVEQVVIQPSNDISHYDTEITYRVFNGGGERI